MYSNNGSSLADYYRNKIKSERDRIFGINTMPTLPSANNAPDTSRLPTEFMKPVTSDIFAKKTTGFVPFVAPTAQDNRPQEIMQPMETLAIDMIPKIRKQEEKTKIEPAALSTEPMTISSLPKFRLKNNKRYGRPR